MSTADTDQQRPVLDAVAFAADAERIDLRPSSSLKGRLRLLISAARVAISFVRNQGRAHAPTPLSS
jgi:CRISPR/Cas system CSM-associated protein Csm3 (group 7 of RAMP superfamily)